MPCYTWAADPNNIISGFETRHAQPDSGALLAWAVLSVESLHYLADIDQDYEVSHQVVGGHSRDIVDVAHARWATGTCITSLDLCAAALGRTFCGHKSSHELALPDFDTSKLSKKAPNCSPRYHVQGGTRCAIYFRTHDTKKSRLLEIGSHIRA